MTTISEERPSGTPGWVDWPRFQMVAGDCGWSDDELRSFYVEGTREALGPILAAAEAGDAATLKRLAHGGRGSSETCGVDGMAELFQALEASAEVGLDDAHDLVERCRRRLGEVDRELAKAIAGG